MKVPKGTPISWSWEDLAAEIDAKIAAHNQDEYAHILGATLADFQANPATGDFSYPQYLNDGSLSTITDPTSVGQYCEVDFGKLVKISRFRHYGYFNSTTDGRFKLEYKDSLGVYHDWVTGIIPVLGKYWSGFDSSGGEVICQGVKLTCTTYNVNSKYFTEMEVIY